jgi:hypothetical protein
MTDELDILLSQPLPSVADGGFTARVLHRVQTQQLWHRALSFAGIAACVLLAIVLLPLHSIGTEFGTLVPKIAGCWAVNFAAAALVLTFLLDRQFSRL